MTDPETMKKARQILGVNQTQMGSLLGWSNGRQVSNIELGVRPLTGQTMVAIEGLLRREGKWSEFILSC